ncbi:SIS domain-containing protein [Vibrio rhodolitus]|uniref:SIS domain-containing protein n=1 Tax=Vibrio rhodolitus TaxID=2231649 RepID=UPI000E0C4D86|nr:SIS domain-containing protein [Vibrio rhodolitus]
MNFSTNQVYPRIRMTMPSLTKTEKKIAEFFLTPRTMRKDVTINSVAEQLDVSTSLIVKLAKKLGYDGFKELKAELLLVESEKQYLPDQKLNKDDDCAQIVQKVLNNSLNALQEVLSFSNVPKIEKAAKMVVNARKLSLFAVGGTSVIAEDFHHKLLRIGIHSYVPKDYHMMIMTGSLMSEEDVVLVISHSGQTIDLIDAVEEAKKSGASVIAITNNYNSKLTSLADCAIFAPASPEPILGKNGTARLVKIALVDCLFATVANLCPDMTKISIDKTGAATSRLHK